MSEQNMQGLASAISSITSDPELMERLRGAVAQTQQSETTQDRALTPKPASPTMKNAADRRKLLEALRPFLSAERREKADTLINVISLLDSGVLDMIRKGDGR